MHKKLIIFILLTFLFSCSKEDKISTTTNSGETNNIIAQENNTYTVNSGNLDNINLYGKIISENSKTFTSNISGTIGDLKCQVGALVSKGQSIANIKPDTNDVSYKTYLIQLSSLNSQVENINYIKNSTIANLDKQKNQLIIQQKTLKEQVEIYNSNLKNLVDLKSIGGSNIALNRENLNSQLEKTKESKSIMENTKSQSLANIDNSIKNTKNQIVNSLDQAFDLIDKTFGITENRKAENDDFEIYLCAKNTTIKNQIEQDFAKLYAKNFKSFDPKDISSNLQEISILLNNASNCMKTTIETTTLTKTTINSLYSSFNSYSSSMLSSKTSLDNLLDSSKTTTLNYDSQLKSLDNSILSIENNIKTIDNNSLESSNINYDNQINSLNAQIQSANNSLDSINEQIGGLDESKSTQLKQFENQIVTLNQSINTINVSLSGQNIISDIDGKVSSQDASLSSKVQAGGKICTIIPNDNSLKLRIFSPKLIELNTVFNYNKDAISGTGTISYELPQKDETTKNYIYESKIDFTNLKSGDTLNISLNTNIGNNSNEIWIPIDYIKPKLDGNYVDILKEDKSIISTKIQTSTLNNNSIKVDSGLNIGDVITK